MSLRIISAQSVSALRFADLNPVYCTQEPGLDGGRHSLFDGRCWQSFPK